MKGKLTAALLAAGSSFACLSGSYAGNLQGGELTYTTLAPNTYQVNCKLFTECSSSAPATATLALIAPGCNAGRTVTLTKTGTPRIGDTYCAAIPNVCTSNLRTNYEENTYTATVTFSAAEAACSYWLLSVSDTARATVRNLSNPQGLHLETMLNLQPGMQNSAAQLNPNGPMVELVCVAQDTRLNLAAYDPDCDSLSYELVAPFSAAGVPYQYAPISVGQTGQYFPNPNPPAPYCNTCIPANPQFGYFVGGGTQPTTFSPTYPLPSYNANWNAIDPATGIPYKFVPFYQYFELNSRTGELCFRPSVYYNTPPVQGDNKYAVSVKVNEWRKVNGAITQVGSVQRDMLFVVEDCAGNNNPTIPAITANGRPVQNGEVLTLRPNSLLNLQFQTNDSDSSSVLTLESDVTSVLPGATFNKTTAAMPTGTISWRATGNGACGIRYFYLKVRDNACPVKGKNVYVIGVRVVKNPLYEPVKENPIYNQRFMAYPNPYTDRVDFHLESTAKSGSSQIVIYNGLGQEIDRFSVPAGTSEVEWTAANRFPAGTYVASLLSENQPTQTLKFIRLR